MSEFRTKKNGKVYPIKSEKKESRYMTEQERQDYFVRVVGGRQKAEKMHRLWQNTYPRYCSLNDGYPKQHTKQEVFLVKAKEEGFTKKQIDAFLAV